MRYRQALKTSSALDRGLPCNPALPVFAFFVSALYTPFIVVIDVIPAVGLFQYLDKV